MIGRQVWIKTSGGWLVLWTEQGKIKKASILGYKGTYLIVGLEPENIGPRRSPLQFSQYEKMQREGFILLPWEGVKNQNYSTCWMRETGGLVKEACRRCLNFGK